MRNYPGRSLKIILLLVGCALFIFAVPRAHYAAADDGCVTCHARLDASKQIVALHRASSHGRAQIGCAECHLGNAAATDKAEAHAEMIAKPAAQALLDTCGRCHTAQLAQFKTSRHFQTRQGEPRLTQLDCAECHGVHSIGRPSESFSFTQYCAGCHGLEYLPALPPQFQDLLALSDELRDAFNREGRAFSAATIKQRKEIRRMTAEIVHPTDRVGGLARIPSILALGNELRVQLTTQRETHQRKK